MRGAITVLLLVATAGSVGAAAASSTSATRSASYDGLVFRVTANAGEEGSVAATGCPDTLKSLGQRLPIATTLHPAASSTAMIDGSVNLTYNGNDLISIFGVARFSSTTQLILATGGDGTCGALKPIGTSPAGDVYAVDWTEDICDTASCSQGHDGQTGNGCVALTRTAAIIAATFQVGACTPTSLPAFDPGSVGPMPPSFTGGMFDGMLVRFSGNTVSGRVEAICGRGSTRLAFGNSFLGMQTLRPPTRPLAISTSGDGTFFGWGSKNSLLSWAARMTISVDLTSTFVSFTTTPKDTGSCKGWKRQKRRSLRSVLPLYVKANGHPVGRAWMKLNIASLKNGKNPWSFLVAFGAPNFSAS